MDAKIEIEHWARSGKALDPELANYEIWNSLVQAYSNMSLTVPGDKLVALSGLAKRFMAILDDTYVAGMWRRHLDKSLCWFADLEGQATDPTTCRPATYRAPTWSWAATDMPIYIQTHCEGILKIAVVDVVLQHPTSDTTGVVTSGSLTLMGHLRPMQLKQRYHEAFAQVVGPERGWNSYYISINGPLNSPKKEPQDLGRRAMLILLDSPPQDDDAFHVDNLANNLYYMVCWVPARNSKHVQILLLRLVDTDKKLYERIGVASSYSKEEHEVLLADIDEEVKQRLPCLNYQNGLHTIRII
jgi:hypothetical protein